MPQWLTNQHAGSTLKSPWARLPTIHLSSFCLKLDLVTEAVEQWTSLVECDLDWWLCWGKAVVCPAPAVKQLLQMRWLRVAHSWSHGADWTSYPLLWEPQRPSLGGLDSNSSVSDSDCRAFLGGVEWCMGCNSHWGPLGVWFTRVALPACKLDWPLYLGVVLFDFSSSENSCKPANKLGSV